MSRLRSRTWSCCVLVRERREIEIEIERKRHRRTDPFSFSEHNELPLLQRRDE